MRVLLLMRGAPGCGKSTWVNRNGLSEYALSADNIRMMTASRELKPDGTYGISQSNDKFVWEILFRILEQRMRNGEFTVIDATNSKTSEMKRYKEYCDRYRYRCYIVDFTNIPIDVVKERNKNRPQYKQVPESVIDNQYARFETQKIPSGITVISPDELDKIWLKPQDFSTYKKVHVIGDVHGCATALKTFFDKVGFHDDELYIFAGDYIDRGIENAETLRFLFSIYEKPNVYLLEGNHERWLWKWANGVVADSKEFELCTKTELENAGIDKKDARKFYRKLGQCAYFRYYDKFFIVTHGGLSRVPYCVTKIPSSQMIRGTGTYEDDLVTDETFRMKCGDCLYQIHGHRNVKGLPVRVNAQCFNLEGRVEFGGCLRAVTIDPNGKFVTHEIQNTVYKEPEYYTIDTNNATSDVGNTIIELRKNRYIQEKSFGNISSFNFTRQAFYDQVWNAQTIKARGLYINIPKQKVVCRGYQKFFGVGDRPETKLESLGSLLEFPATAYVKENGFLGLVSYNDETDDLFITTKSNPEAEFAGWLRDMFYASMAEKEVTEIKEYLKREDVTLAFECIDTEHDPHIIKYNGSQLILLDIIKNQLAFQKLPYEEVQSFAKRFGLEYKERACVIGSWQEFVDWYRVVLEPDYEYEGQYIEGFVVEDANGYMLKLKLSYYNFWKFMRSIAHETIKKGYIDPRRTAGLTTPLANEFYAWIKNLRAETPPEEIPKDICSLRDMYYTSYKSKLEGECSDGSLAEQK